MSHVCRPRMKLENTGPEGIVLRGWERYDMAQAEGCRNHPNSPGRGVTRPVSRASRVVKDDPSEGGKENTEERLVEDTA